MHTVETVVVILFCSQGTETGCSGLKRGFPLSLGRTATGLSHGEGKTDLEEQLKSWFSQASTREKGTRESGWYGREWLPSKAMDGSCAEGGWPAGGRIGRRR